MLNRTESTHSQTGYNFNASIERYHITRNVFCANIRHLIKANGYSILGFVKKAKADGLNIDRNQIIRPSQTR